MELQNYLFTDSKMIKMYLDQIPESKHTKNKIKRKVGLSLTGPSFDMEIENDEKGLNLYEQIVYLERYFKKHKIVSDKRPKKLMEALMNEIPFVKEKINATKLVFSSHSLDNFKSLNHLVIWVAEPNPDDLGKKEFDFSGSFLYLLESIGDSTEYSTHFSGVSALQALSNIIHGKNILEFHESGGEPLGRENSIHPIEKLKSLGAIESGKRQIETLYKSRYFSDEQSYTYAGNKYRTCDLLAYIKES